MTEQPARATATPASASTRARRVGVIRNIGKGVLEVGRSAVAVSARDETRPAESATRPDLGRTAPIIPADFGHVCRVLFIRSEVATAIRGTMQPMMPRRMARSHTADSGGSGSTLIVASGASVVLGMTWLAVAGPVLAHAGQIAPEPRFPQVLLAWSFDPTIQLPLLLAAFGWIWAVRRVDQHHPASPVPLARTVAFLGGLAVIDLALQSPLALYDDTLFAAHMVQHVMLTLFAPPLIALGAPVTLLLRVARPDLRRRFILPVLHSRIFRAVSHPVVAWSLFAGTMWATHFSPIFEQALQDDFVHDLEHVAYLVTGMLFWWPAVGLDPSPWRIPHPLRVLYVFLQMPQNTFLALAIYSASAPLYPTYANMQRGWGPSPLADQQLAGGLMWVIGDLTFLVAILALVVAWMRADERAGARHDARLDAERAEIHARELRLAERLARESPGGWRGGGPPPTSKHKK
jgi:putative membrane protein